MREERTVRVNKEQLLTKLKLNREMHADVYKDAMQDWKTDLHDAAAVLAQEPESEDAYKKYQSVRSARPQSYLREYDKAIVQIGFEQRDAIDLGLDEADAFLSDDWDWARTAYDNSYFSASSVKMSQR